MAFVEPKVNDVMPRVQVRLDEGARHEGGVPDGGSAAAGDGGRRDAEAVRGEKGLMVWLFCSLLLSFRPE